MRNHQRNLAGPRRRAMHLSAILLVVLIAIGGAGSARASANAQGDGLVNGDSYDLDIGGLLSWDRPWEVDLNLTAYDSATDSDLIVLRNDTATVIVLAEKAEQNVPDDYRDRIVQTARNDWNADILTTFEDDAGSHAAWIEGSGESAFGAYYLASLDGDDLITTRLTAPVTQFDAYWKSLTDRVDLDGAPLFRGVDADEAVAIVTEGVERDNAESPGESSDSANSRSDPGDSPDSAGGSTADAEAASPAQSEDAPDLEAAGLVNPGEYESPQFGYTIGWNDEWDLDDFYDAPVVTETEDGADACYLASMDREDLLGYVSLEGHLNEYDSVREYIGFLTSDDNLSRAYPGQKADVVIEKRGRETGGYLLKLTNQATDVEIFVLIEVTDVGRGVVVVTLFSAATDVFMDSLGSAQDGIQLDSQPVLSIIRNNDVEQALDS